jgi:hypothetical protein
MLECKFTMIDKQMKRCNFSGRETKNLIRTIYVFVLIIVINLI